LFASHKILEDFNNEFSGGELPDAFANEFGNIVFADVSTPAFMTLPLVRSAVPNPTLVPLDDFETNSPDFDPTVLPPAPELDSQPTPLENQRQGPVEVQPAPDLEDDNEADVVTMDIGSSAPEPDARIIFEEAFHQPDVMMQILFAAAGLPVQLQ
jgi:hypothetical protein